MRTPQWSGNMPANNEEARDRLIEIFIDCVLTRGEASVNMSEVAREAGVARTTVYRQFSNLTELYFSSIEKVFLEYASGVAEHLSQFNDLEQQLTEALLLTNKHATDESRRGRFLRTCVASDTAKTISLEGQEEARLEITAIALQPVFDAHPHIKKHRSALLDLMTRITLSQLARPFPDKKSVKNLVKLVLPSLKK